MKTVTVEKADLAVAEAAVPEAAAPPLDDRLLQELAKRRLYTKRSLIGQALDYLLLVFCAFIIVNADYYESALVAFLLCAFWGLRLAYRAFKFMRPSFREGVAAYFRRRKEQQLEFEYSRLKQMSTEYVAKELSK